VLQLPIERPRADTTPWALESLPPFPPVAARLLRLISSETASFREVSEVIRTDAAISTEVLRLSNSAMFGMRHEMKSVFDAATLLGVERLKGLVVTVALRDFLYSIRHQRAFTRCWRHNLACALISESLSEACCIDKGIAYTAGLMHDLGRLALLAAHPKEYGQLLRSCANPGAMLELERATFGLDHAQAGLWLSADWDLPEELSDVMASHHDAGSRDPSSLANQVALGCRMADSSGFPVCGQPPALDLEWVAARLPNTAWAKVEQELDTIASEVALKINLFECDFLNAMPARGGPRFS